MEDERKQLLYDRSILEDTLHKSPHLFHDTDMDTLSGAGLNFHHNFLSPCHSSTAGGPHDNFGAVSSPNSTLKWETCSDGSIERDEFLSLENNPIMEDEECNSSTGGPGGNRNNFKGSTIYLYIENDKRSHRNSAQSETQNKGSMFNQSIVSYLITDLNVTSVSLFYGSFPISAKVAFHENEMGTFGAHFL